MKDKSCLMSIKNRFEKLTKTEKIIARYILDNKEKVVKSSVAEISAETGCVKSAVIRCCKSLGFDGFAELRLSLAMEISKNRQLNFTPYINPDDNASQILDKVFAANVKTLHDTAEKIDRGLLQQVVDLLSGAKSVYVYGIGTSTAMVMDFQYRLMLLGVNAFCYTDAPVMKISTLNITEGDVAIGISHSGRTMATIDALKLAKEMGAKTVCLTTYPESEIVSLSDYPLTVCSDEVNYPVEAVSARISQISVLDAIAIAMSAKKYDETKKRAEKSHEFINTVRYGERK